MLKGQFGPIHVHSSSMYNDNDMHEAGYIAYEGEVTTLIFSNVRRRVTNSLVVPGRYRILYVGIHELDGLLLIPIHL